VKFDPAPREGSYNLVLGIGFGIFILFLCVFGAALLGSHAGEVANATGAVLGGIIGALGAALAVYLTLSGQNRQEATKVSDALIREVLEFARLGIGHLDNCVSISKGTITVPVVALPGAMAMPEPIIYKSVADRIGLANSPQIVVAFYTRLTEIKTGLEVLASHPILARGNADGKMLKHIALGWLDVLGMAKGLISDHVMIAELDSVVQQHVCHDIEVVSAAARTEFA